jgi:hypothetical protein
LSNNETKIQKLATENDAITFVLVDAENSWSRKLANVSNLYFATFVNGYW